jgi:hypothetical protein
MSGWVAMWAIIEDTPEASIGVLALLTTGWCEIRLTLGLPFKTQGQVNNRGFINSVNRLNLLNKEANIEGFRAPRNYKAR